MKIFIVQSELGGGGAERVGVLLANGFADRKHEVCLLTNLNEAVEYQVSDKVHVINIVPSQHNKFFKWGGALLNLRRFVKRFRPDVIIGIMQLCAFLSKVACIGTPARVIMTEHNSFERPPSAPMSKINYFCKYYLNKIYQCVTVLSRADKDCIKGMLKVVMVMPNPLLLSPVKFIPFKNSIVLAAGRLDAWHVKGFDVLIRAWTRVVSSLELQDLTPNPSTKGDGNYGWRLQIAGTGSQESLNYLKQLCRENGVEDSVEFLGFRKDVEKLYQDASIFVMSSRYEGFGLVLIEAMSQGCACVACDYKGRQREIVAPLEKSEQSSKFKVQSSNSKFEACANGILCEPDDVESLASGIKKMIEDDEYRESVRSNAIERSKYYSIEKTIDRWEELIDHVIWNKEYVN